jgi:riboflavin kinase/FMN adenylyltransferase
VYSCWFTRSLGSDRRLPAAVSVGTNPTFSGRERTVEAFVLDVDEDFYGQHVSLDFAAKLRDQVKFSSPEALVAQIDEDVIRTREVLGVGP